jgi:bifunctional non-homologous end joining protein LigD
MGVFVKPMLAPKKLEEPFDDPLWLYETKYDGVRAEAHFDNYKLDGEIVCFDKKGRSDWNALQHRIGLKSLESIALGAQQYPASFVAFDVMVFKGQDITNKTLRERKRYLTQALHENKKIAPKLFNKTGGEITRKYPDISSFVLSHSVARYGKRMYKEAEKLGDEGIMAKNLESTYHAGKRTRDWLKIKTWKTEEFYVVGYTKGLGNREDYLGALVLMDSDKKYAGRVGGGLTRPLMDYFLHHVRKVEASPCSGLPKGAILTHPIYKIPVTYHERAGANNTGRLRFPKLAKGFTTQSFAVLKKRTNGNPIVIGGETSVRSGKHQQGNWQSVLIMS